MAKIFTVRNAYRNLVNNLFIFALLSICVSKNLKEKILRKAKSKYVYSGGHEAGLLTSGRMILFAQNLTLTQDGFNFC